MSESEQAERLVSESEYAKIKKCRKAGTIYGEKPGWRASFPTLFCSHIGSFPTVPILRVEDSDRRRKENGLNMRGFRRMSESKQAGGKVSEREQVKSVRIPTDVGRRAGREVSVGKRTG